MPTWLVEKRNIAPHIPVIDKSARHDGTFAREDFRYDPDADTYICPAGKVLTTSGTLVNDRATLLYRGSTRDLWSLSVQGAMLSQRASPKDPAQPLRRCTGQSPIGGGDSRLRAITS